MMDNIDILTDPDWLHEVTPRGFGDTEVFHLQGQHDQQSHAGGRGKNSTGLDYDPRTEIPTKRPGEAEIPEGAVRLSHRTWTTNLDSILENGLEARDAGDGSGDAVWAAAGVGVGGEKPGGPWQAESDIAFIEFWAMPNELGVGNNQDPAWLEERSAHVTMGAMPPERIVGAYVPWHAAYWGFESRTSGTFEEVNSGFYDSIGRDYPDTYGRAIDYIKSQSQDEELSVEVFHLQGQHDQQSHAGGRGKGIPEGWETAPDGYTEEAQAEWAAGAAYLAEGGEMPDYWKGLDYMGEDGLPVEDGQVGFNYEESTLDETTALREKLGPEVAGGVWMMARHADSLREEAIHEAIAMNEISPEDAEARYRYDSRADHAANGWEPLPDRLYHATSKLGAISADGSLKSRREIGGRASAAGLGGGPDSTISFTADRGIAEGISRSLHDARRALNMSPEELVSELEQRSGSWWPQVRDSARNVHGVDGVPKTIEEQYDLFRSFTYQRQINDGVLDPLFFNVNPENLRDMNPADIGIVEVAPAVTGAKGYQVSSLGEWRVPTGRTVDIMQIEQRDDPGQFALLASNTRFGPVDGPTGVAVTNETQVFHLQGTENDHDQSSHARKNADGETIQDVGKTIPEKRDPDDVLDEWRATPEEFAAAQKLAAEKARNVPKPTKAQIEKNQKMLANSKRAGGWGRGNSFTRRARAQALFEEFGGTPGGYCPCGHCGIKVSPKGEGGFAKMTQDKILTAAEGGTYGTVNKGFPNLIPACGGCNSSRNQEAYYVRPDWDEEPLAASAGFGEDVATGEEYIAARAVGRPLGWDDWLAPEVGTEPVEGEYVIRSVDTWFGPYDQHLIAGDVCDPETIETPEDGELALEVFHLQGQHDQQNHAGGRGGTAVLDSPAEALVAGENVTVTGAEAADLLVEIGKADDGVVDLTNLTIEGDPYLFRGVEETGIRERGDMPQVPERALDAFHDHLEDEGVTFNKEQIDPRSVKSTQTNLDATKVGQMIARVRDGSYTTGHDPWISNDGFILDGHHRWGTMAVLSAAGEEHPAFDVTRVSLPIAELLVLADDFNDENDIDSKTIDMAVQEAFRADFRAEFHLDGQHDQQSHAGGRSKASNTVEVPEGATVVEDDAWAEREGNERLSGEGDCYPTANMAVWDKVGSPDEDNWRAVHGVVTGQGELEGVRFGHAWAEETQRFPIPENIMESGSPEQRAAWENMTFTIVHDNSNGNSISMPAEMYYAVGQIDEATVQRYTPAEVGRNMVNSGHHGPWEDEDL